MQREEDVNAEQPQPRLSRKPFSHRPYLNVFYSFRLPLLPFYIYIYYKGDATATGQLLIVIIWKYYIMFYETRKYKCDYKIVETLCKTQRISIDKLIYYIHLSVSSIYIYIQEIRCNYNDIVRNRIKIGTEKLVNLIYVYI